MSLEDSCLKCQESVVERESLKCKRCEKSVHKVCLAFGTPGDLHGDVFFDMICSRCYSQGRETFMRKKLPWIMVVVLVIYNLSIKCPGLGNHGYYHYRIHIANFVYKNWAHLFTPEFKRKKNWVGSVAGTLSHFNRVYFMSGSEELGSNGWWKLIRNESPLSYFYQYEESQKQRQSFMRKAAQHHLPAEDTLQMAEGSISIREEEIPEKKIKIEEVSIEDLFEPISESLSTEDMPDIASRGENFLFSWEEMSQNLKEEPKEIQDDIEIKEEVQSEEEAPKKYPYKPVKSLFRVSEPKKSPQDIEIPFEETTEMMNAYEEGELLKKLKEIFTKKSSEEIPEDIRRFYRKLSVREDKRRLLKPLHNIDSSPENDKLKPQVILERFHQLTCSGKSSEADDVKFSSRLVGNVEQELFQSPFTGRILQPFIYRDSVSMPQWVKLMCELQFTVNQGEMPSRAPIDFCYVRPHHIPAVNSLLQRLFWPGIDMSECLMYPDFSVIALYKQLIIGCAFLVPDVGHNEAYISFMAVRPGWQKAGVASFMLYHLTQTCPEKDITLHVSATNSAVFLYQKFGFKIEEMILDFYDKYLPWESTESRHAFFLRLRR